MLKSVTYIGGQMHTASEVTRNRAIGKSMLSDLLTEKHVILKLLWIAFYVQCLKWLESYTEQAATEQNLVY